MIRKAAINRCAGLTIIMVAYPPIRDELSTRDSAPHARCAGDTARGQGYQLRRGCRTQAALAPVPLLRWPHDRRRDIPARRDAALSASDIPNLDQDRHIMITLDSRPHTTAALLLRRLLTGNDHACPRWPPDHSISAARRRFCLSREVDRVRHPLNRFPNKRSMHFDNGPPATKSP
jgi:hypothetical protein